MHECLRSVPGVSSDELHEAVHDDLTEMDDAGDEARIKSYKEDSCQNKPSRRCKGQGYAHNSAPRKGTFIDTEKCSSRNKVRWTLRRSTQRTAY